MSNPVKRDDAGGELTGSMPASRSRRRSER